jgi:four helix bundle protein
MQQIRDFRQLQVWQEAHRLALTVYQLTRSFPRDELYGLTAQMRRAAVSVAANIAEGHGSGSRREYRRFLLTARASLNETLYHLILATDLGYLSAEDFVMAERQIAQLGKMLNRLIASLQPSSD